MARTKKFDPAKRRKLPEPRYHKSDEFEELAGGRPDDDFLRPPKDTEDLLKELSVKGFGLRRSREAFEAAKEKEEEEESLKQPEYGRPKRAKRRYAKRK